VQGTLAIIDALEANGVDLVAWFLAWARVLPSVMIVPALGAAVLPPPARVVLGLSLAVILTPAMTGAAGATVEPTSGAELLLVFVAELLRGLPAALSVSALLWAAMMAGGLSDDVRGAQSNSGVLRDAPTHTATLFGLFVSFVFLRSGGASSLLHLLGSAVNDQSVMLRATADLVQSVNVALALAAPILAAVIAWEVAGALITRAASPAHTQAMLAPLRALVTLGVLAVCLDSMLALMARLVVRGVG